jgi:hypothetical protein
VFSSDLLFIDNGEGGEAMLDEITRGCCHSAKSHFDQAFDMRSILRTSMAHRCFPREPSEALDRDFLVLAPKSEC